MGVYRNPQTEKLIEPGPTPRKRPAMGIAIQIHGSENGGDGNLGARIGLGDFGKHPCGNFHGDGGRKPPLNRKLYRATWRIRHMMS